MAEHIPPFAHASTAPILRVARPSLAFALTTTMHFTDYALADLATPSLAFQDLARALPADIAEASRPVRAAFAHGSHLRDLLLAQLPADHPGHRDWPALRDWFASLPDDRVLGMVESGIRCLLAFDGSRSPGPPPAEVAGLRGTLDELRLDAVDALQDWPIPSAEERAEELLDPAGVRATLLDLLDALWDGWLGAAWDEALPALDAAVAGIPVPPPGCGGVQWIRIVTGLLAGPYAEAANQARTLTVMPMPGLEQTLVPFGNGDDFHVLYTPSQLADPPPDSHRDGADERRTPDQAGQPDQAGDLLAQLAPTLLAIGEQSRLAIVLQLIERGPLTMQQLTDVLRVHQTTISRQVAALRKSGLANQDDQRRIVLNQAELRRVCQTLLDALNRGGGRG